MIVLEMINKIQTLLRLPLSASLADQHAKLLLAFINQVQRDFMAEGTTWDQCKLYGSFQTVAGVSLYTVSIADLGPGIEELDTIKELCIAGMSEPLRMFDSDEDFRAFKRSHQGTTGLPLAYRRYSRTGTAIVVELCPVPDQVYTVEVEALQKPPLLINATDVPLLDPDTIIAGALALAIDDQGQDASVKMEAFRIKLGITSQNEGDSNWGDVVPA